MSLALRHVHVSVDKALNFQGWGWISARLVSPARGSFSTASSIFVRADMGLVGFWFCFLFFICLLEAGWTWEFIKTAQRNWRHVFVLRVALVLWVRRQEGCVSCRNALGWGEKIAFFFFFKVCYNEMDSCCIWSQKRFLTWYSGTSFSSLGQP